MWGGFEAPDWAKQLGGAPIATEHNGKQRILGRFWSEAYRQAWSRLQVQLAARYDALPLIREVAITSCMSFTAEPFFLPTEPTVANPLRAAGYTDAAHRQCLAARRCRLRAVEGDAARALAQSVLRLERPAPG